jgi:hypothetical protein
MEMDMVDEHKDRLEIVELAFAFSSAVSRLSGPGIEQVFTRDGVLAGVAKLVGQGDVDVYGGSAIGKFFGDIFETLEFVHHTSQVVTTNIKGDRAEATTMILEFARPKAGKLMIVMGDYDDTLVRTDAGWRFTRRALRTKNFSFLAEL